jgi:hypothetical protein
VWAQVRWCGKTAEGRLSGCLDGEGMLMNAGVCDGTGADTEADADSAEVEYIRLSAATQRLVAVNTKRRWRKRARTRAEEAAGMDDGPTVH